jgi:lysophospholipase L1-like esterase
VKKQKVSNKSKVAEKPSPEPKTSQPLLQKALLLLPLVLAITSLLMALRYYNLSAETGRYDFNNTFFLYLCIICIPAAAGFYLLRKWRKLIVINALLIFLLLMATEWLMKSGNIGNILNYSELNEGHFTTNILQYQKMLQRIQPGDFLYLNMKDDKDHLSQKPEYSFRYKLDEYGLNNCKSCKEKGKLGILTLGDSFTWGMGAKAEKSWPQQLEDILVERGATNVRVCNAGVPGSDPIYAFEAYKNVYRSAFEPDILIVAFNASDMNDIVIRGGPDRTARKEAAIASPTWLPWYASSLLYRSIKRSSEKIDPDLLIPESEKQALFFNAMTILFENMLQINQYEALRGKKVIFLYTPIMLDFQQPETTMADLIAEGRNMGLMMVDATEYFKAAGVHAGNVQDYFWLKDSHNNEKGYAIIANAVADYLLKNFTSQ